jgi:hypothetical protein
VIPTLRYKQVCDDLASYFRKGRRVRLVGLVFCRPQAKLAREEIIPSLLYFHYRSGEHCNFYFGGYHQGWEARPGETLVGNQGDSLPWIFSGRDFNKFRREIEVRTRWRYSGGTDLILANAVAGHQPDKADIDFRTAICANLEQMKAEGAFFETGMLFERVFRYADEHGGDKEDPSWGFSDAAGLRLAGSALKELLLAALPEGVRKDVRRAQHFAVTDIGV